MIKLKSLQIQGFRRFKEKVVINFPDSGLLLIDGDSGVGKSTIFQAISYALGVCPYPATELKSWTGEKLQVDLVLQDGDNRYIISRGTTNRFQFNNDEPKTGSKALDEALSSVFKVSPELLFAMTYRPQGSEGLFISKKDQEMKEFLSKILGLQNIEDAVDQATEKRKSLNSQLEYAKGVLVEREMNLARLQGSKPEESPEADLSALELKVQRAQESFDVVSEKYNAVTAEFNAALRNSQLNNADKISALEEKLKQAQGFRDKIRIANDLARNEYRNKSQKLEYSIRKCEDALKEVEYAKKNINIVAGKLNSLKNQLCYTCHQTFSQGEAQIDEFQEQITEFERLLLTEVPVSTELSSLRNELSVLTLTLDPKEQKFAEIVGQIQQEIKDVGKRITDPKVIDLQQQIDTLSRPLFQAKDDLFLAKQDLSEAKTKNLAKTRLAAQVEAQLTIAQRQLDSQKEIVQTTTTQLNQELDFISLLGKDGFLGVIFDEILYDISVRSNDLLKRLPNTARVSVRFENAISAKGKKSIQAIYNVDGFDTSRSGGLSGGMSTSADLVLDLSVLSVIQDRLGVFPGWLCLDECFNGLPVSSKEAAMEILQEYSQDKLIIVVDHGSELRSSFQQILTVGADGGIS